jgi:hypothetical protein
MNSDIKVETASGRALIGESSITTAGKISNSVMALLSKVWEKIHAARVETLGHHPCS